MTRRFQFSIRAILGLMTAVATVAATCGWWIHTSRLQQEAIELVASKGGYDWLDRAGPSIDIEFGVPQHEGCGQILGLAGPRGSEVTFADEDVTVLNNIWRLRRVSFEHSRVTSTAIERFRNSHLHVEISR